MDKIILDQSIQHLLKDDKLKDLINKHPIPKFAYNDNYFEALSKSIIYQQLSGKVAKIIYTRFIGLFISQTPEPVQYLKISTYDLREIGLSKQKINYIKNLSLFFADNHLDKLKKMSDQEISKELISIKGVGQWTIDMFMMFTLCRPDVLPVGDLGIKKAFKYLYDLQELPSEKIMKEKSSGWRPYRTIACCYLWRVVDDGDIF